MHSNLIFCEWIAPLQPCTIILLGKLYNHNSLCPLYFISRRRSTNKCGRTTNCLCYLTHYCLFSPQTKLFLYYVSWKQRCSHFNWLDKLQYMQQSQIHGNIALTAANHISKWNRIQFYIVYAKPSVYKCAWWCEHLLVD